MNTKILFFVVVVVFLLAGCSKPSPSTPSTETTKQPFFITLAPYTSLQKQYTLKKTGKLASTSEITVSAQIGGRVTSLNKGIGDSVDKGTSVIQLQETSGVYSFGAQKAATAVTQAQISYEQTMLNLEKAIQDSEFGIQQAQNQAQNASLNSEVSAATIQLQSAKESFEKAKLDYQTKLRTDEQTIVNFGQTASNLVNDVKLLYESAIVEADKILGVTPLRQTNNDLYENLLGARNTSTKFAAEDALRQALVTQSNLALFTITPDSYNFATDLEELTNFVRALQPMLNNIDTMLQYTIAGNTYSETQLAVHQGVIDGLQAQTQGVITTITAQINTIQSFLRTYKDNQSSLAKAVDLSEQSYKTAQANLETIQNNTKIQVSSLTNTLEATLKNKATTEKALQNNIKQAQIAYSEVGFQLSKLTTSAPIAGTITDILVDMGQDVSPGTPLYKINSVGNKEIELTLTQEEAKTLTVGTQVEIRFGTVVATGTLSQMSSTPTAGVSYKAIVTTDSNNIPAGSLVDIIIQQPIENFVVPLNRVQLLSTTEGQINLWDGNVLETKKVSLGKVKGKEIEIISPLSPTQDIVISDIKQYDPDKYEIIVKQNTN